MPDVQAMIDAPLPSGQVRILYCTLCGAITYIRFAPDPDGLGDPHLHNLYHVKRGEVPGAN